MTKSVRCLGVTGLVVGLLMAGALSVAAQGLLNARQNVTTDTVLDFKGICFRSLLGINDEVLADTNRFSYAKDWIPAIELGERFVDFTNATVMVRKDRNTGKLALSDVKFVKALGPKADEKVLLKEYEHAVDLVCKLLGVNVTCPGLVDPATYLRRRFLLPMDRRIKSRICLNLAKGQRVEIEATEASYIIRAGQPMQTGAPTVEIKFAYNGSFGVRRSGGQDSGSVKELTLGTDCSDLLSARMKALPEQQRQQIQLIQEELKRVREAKAAATKSECAASCSNSKSSTEKISVAEKLGQCDFLLNKNFKKSAKVYLCLFSASWCPPCRREMPRIAKTYAETLKGDPDIELIHFSRDQNDEKAMAWAKEHDVQFPVVKPKGGNPLDLYSRGIPHLFIVKADGTLVEEGHPMRIFNEEKFGEIKGAVGQAKPQSVKADIATQNDRKSDGVQLWENGPYWAECNVGALKPEESGYHFWWGDTVGYRRDGRNWVSSKGMRMTVSPFEKSSCLTWDKSNSELLTLGYTDSTGNLVPSHDAATVHLGVPWRMPTEAELVALVQNCDSEWAMCNGVEGRLVKGRGAYVSKSIFLPAGSYWPSSPESNSPIGAKLLSVGARDFGRNNYGRGLNFSCGRMNSHSIRPVRGCAKSDDHVTGSSDKGVVTFTDGKYTWTAVRKDGGLCLMAASPELSGDVILPMVGNGIEVKGVGELAFRSKSKLKTLQIPGRIQIGQGAFRQCENLESVTMKGGTAGWSAFSGCEKLGEVFVGKDVSGLWYRSFADCTSLTNVIFEDGAKPLSLQAPFKGDVKLERLHLPARFRFEASWHNGAFSSCDALTNLTIDARNRYCKVENGIVMSLDGKKVYAFATGFSSFTFPATVEEITYRATEGCNKVREFLFPDSLRTLDSQSIYECKALESVTMGAGVKRIGGSLFYQCDNLQSITMRGEKPDSAENIFSNGKSLKTIHVSANAKSWAGMKEWQGIPLVFDAETK